MACLWTVTVQRDRGQAAACLCCRRKFNAGELRVSRARAVAQRYSHLHCMQVSLGRRDVLEGFQELPAELAAAVEPYLEQDIDMAGSQESADASMHDAEGLQESQGSQAEKVNVAAIFEQDENLKNMAWWDNHGEELLLNQAGTLAGVPGQLSIAISEAVEAVSRYTLQAASEVEEVRGWKCLLAMNRLLFGELVDPTDTKQHRTVADRVAQRLHDLWAGSWESLMNDTHVDVRPASDPSSSRRTARKVERLLLKGEISKATTAAWGPAKVRTPAMTAAAFAAQQPVRARENIDAEQPDGSGVHGAVLAADVAAYLKASWAKTPRGAEA